jgi:hypothetical protein
MTHRILRPLPSAVYTSGQKAPLRLSTVHRPLSIPRSVVRGLRSTFQAGKPTLRPSTVHSAVCRPRSAVCIRLFVPHSLTVCFPGRLENLPYCPLPSAVYISGWEARPAIVQRPSSTVHSAVCRPRSAVCIRLFVPPSLTVCIPGSLENLPYCPLPSAV